MHPISYKKEGNKIIFIYDEADRNDKVSGTFIVSIEEHIRTYTNNPFKPSGYITLVHNPIFDGEEHEPDWYLKYAVGVRHAVWWKEHMNNIDIKIIKSDNNDKPENKT